MVPRFLTFIIPVMLLLNPLFPDGFPQDAPKGKQYFIALFSRGSGWDHRKPVNEQSGFGEHSENLRRLQDRKSVV